MHEHISLETKTRRDLETYEQIAAHIKALIDKQKAILKKIEEFAITGSIEDGKALPLQEAAVQKLQELLNQQEAAMGELVKALGEIGEETRAPHTIH